MNRISELTIPSLETAVFGFRPTGPDGATFLGQACVSLDLVGRPQVSIRVWDREDVETPQHTWDSMGAFYVTTNEDATVLYLHNWVSIIGGNPVQYDTIPGSETDWDDFFFLPDEEQLDFAWGHLASSLAGAGRLVAYEEVDLSEHEQLESTEFRSALEIVGTLDGEALTDYVLRHSR